MNTTSRRSGFTLVEMLIVLGVIATVAAIFVPIVLNMTDRNQVPKGASMLENALALAKARAVAEKRPNGIRLLATTNNLRTTTSGAAFAWYDEIQYIEDPGDYVNGWVWGFADSGIQTVTQPYWINRPTPIPGEPPAGLDDSVTVPAAIPNFQAQTTTGIQTIDNTVIPRSRLLFGLISPDVGAPDNNRWTGNLGIQRLPQRMAYSWYEGSPVPVLPGDVIEISGVGELYKIVAVSSDQAPAGPAVNNPAIIAANGVRAPIVVLDRPLSRNVLPSLTGYPNFRIIRQPRAIPSLPPMKLPQDVVVDFTPSLLVGGVRNAKDLGGTIYMSGVGNGNANPSGTGSGVQTSEITGLTTNTAPAGQTAPLFIDIMFSPTGEIIPTSQTGGLVGTGAFFTVGQSGLIALWLHSRGDPNLWAARQITAAQGNADNQAIVAINGRTGFIGSYPLSNNTADPLANARTGKARISADTGQ